jgi:hypothetical protein
VLANHIADLAKWAPRVAIDSRLRLDEATNAHRRIESCLGFGRLLLIP